MARHEADREDLLREATALVERAEWDCDGQPIVVGFRRNGSVSVYAGADPVFQFQTSGALRRAYLDGRLVKAVEGHLIVMERRRDASGVSLIASRPSPATDERILRHARDTLARVAKHLADGSAVLVGQVPPEGDVTGRVREALDRLLAQPLVIADSPHA